MCKDKTAVTLGKLIPVKVMCVFVSTITSFTHDGFV